MDNVVLMVDRMTEHASLILAIYKLMRHNNNEPVASYCDVTNNLLIDIVIRHFVSRLRGGGGV